MNFYVGMDLGTSGVRAIALDEQGQIVAEVSDRFGNSPQTPDLWKAAFLDLLGQIPRTYRQQTRAIAIDGTSSTVLLCDTMGIPLTEPLLYNDASHGQEVEPLRTFLAAYPHAPGRDTVLSATSSLVKLLGWRSCGQLDQARYFLHQADWLAFLLHGQLGLSDYHNSLKLGYDVARLEYPTWMADLGIMSWLPQVVAPGSAIAPVLPTIAKQFEFPADCYVCAGTTDSIAAFLASGATRSGEAVTSLGSTLVLKLLSDTPVENGQYGIYSHRLGDRWLVGGASNTGGAVLQHYFTPQELIDLSAQIDPTQPSPLHYYPLLQPGDRFPINDPTLAPQLDPRPENPVAFLQGLLEGMARIEAQGYHLLEKLGATPVQQVYTAGGGANNSRWTQLRARFLGVPVQPSDHTEAAYGAALLARSSQRTGDRANVQR